MLVTGINLKLDHESLSSPGETEFALSISGIVLDEELGVASLASSDQSTLLMTWLTLIAGSINPDGPTDGSSRSGPQRIIFSVRPELDGAQPVSVVTESGQTMHTTVRCQVIDSQGKLILVHLPLAVVAAVVPE